MRQLPAHLGKVAVVLLLLVCGWVWFFVLEEKTQSRSNTSLAAIRNPLLAAEKLLTRYDYRLDQPDMLSSAMRDTLADGTMLIADNHGVMTKQELDRLLAWVRRGNTLIVKPRQQQTREKASCGGAANEPALEPPDASADQEDLIGQYFATVRVALKAAPTPTFRCTSEVQLPGKSRSLRVETRHAALRSAADTPSTPSKSSTLLIATDALRLFRHGDGHVVFVADDVFTNQGLAWSDHGELLLGLAELQPKARHVTFVKQLDLPSWHQALWWNFPHVVIGIGLFLCLLFWRAVRRFGPLDTGTASERRSLIEHVEASGRWLWSVPGGRELLLGAVRRAVETVLLRARPELRGIDARERTALLAATCSIPADQLHHALHGPAAARPAEFADQIRILQRLKRHHE